MDRANISKTSVKSNVWISHIGSDFYYLFNVFFYNNMFTHTYNIKSTLTRHYIIGMPGSKIKEIDNNKNNNK